MSDKDRLEWLASRMTHLSCPLAHTVILRTPDGWRAQIKGEGRRDFHALRDAIDWIAQGGE